VDHSTINRWVIKYSPQLEDEFHRRKRSVWVSWRMDETYLKVKGVWVYLYRAVDKYGKTIDFLLTQQRDKKVAYLLPADIISRLPPCRLNDTNQPVIGPRNPFSSPRPRLLACI
jgi:transposase-like protein